ncbi:MAG: hypothetical protein ACI8RD_012139 [Bacillariaceae sp.]|jgi:hypothetical protein
MMSHNMLLRLSCLIAIAAKTASGFSTVPSTLIRKLSNSPTTNTHDSLLFLVDDDIPSDDSTEYTGSVDWDAEWKKVVDNEGQLKTSGKDRPGKDFYKSEAEITAIKAANKATEKITDVSSTVSNSLPDIRSLSGDWRFWIGILALVSIGFSVLTAPSGNISPSGLNGDSFYI